MKAGDKAAIVATAETTVQLLPQLHLEVPGQSRWRGQGSGQAGRGNAVAHFRASEAARAAANTTCSRSSGGGREGIDFEGEHHTKEVERIRNLKGSDAEKRAAIKASGKATEINREVQDIIDLFEKKAKPSLRAPGMFDVNKLSKADLKDPLVSQLWKAWQTLSTNAKGARVGDPAALERVRAIGRWLTKGTAKEQREMFPDYDPKRAPIASPSQQVQSFSDQLPNEIVERTRPANNVLIDILKSIGQ